MLPLLRRVELPQGGKVRFTLGTRLRNRKLFGHIYMGLIDRPHCGYVAPAMLSMAAEHLIAEPTLESSLANAPWAPFGQ